MGIKFSLWGSILLLLTIFFSFYLDQGFKLNDKSIPGLAVILNPSQGLWQNTENYNNKVVQKNPISQEINIHFDERMVPHIFAQNMEDALFAQGYVEAKLRAWQMDFLSRVAAGRLSEVVGKKTIPKDVEMRKYKLNVAAKESVDAWKEFPSFNLMEKYIQGVNASLSTITNRTKPVENKLMNYDIEAWTAEKSALVYKYMAYVLCARSFDIEYTNTKQLLGDDFEELFFDQDSTQIPVIRENKARIINISRSKPPGVEYTGDPLKSINLKEHPSGIGSNNWAISGYKTNTNYPILSNDPHLNLSLPSIWIEMHINTPNFNAYGVSIPGIPGLMIGFNEDIAWGSTNVGQDVLDIYAIDWIDKENGVYELNGKPDTANIRKEIIKVKGQDDLILNFRDTHFGPVVFDHSDGKQDIAMDWLAHYVAPNADMNVFPKIMACQDFSCFKKATEKYFAPAQNLVFASRSGDIGLCVSGDLPIKYENEGVFVKNGNNTKHKWSKKIPKTSNPYTLNPDLGFVASANQMSTDSSFSVPYFARFEQYRGKRINHLLESKDTFSVQDMFDYQADSYSLKAKEIMPTILECLIDSDLNQLEKENLDSLKAWNFRYEANSSAAVIFHRLSIEIEKQTWDEIPINTTEYPTIKPPYYKLVDMLNHDKRNIYFDQSRTPRIENACDIILMSYKSICSDQKESNYKSWKSYNPVNINHLANIDGFSVKQLPMSGCGDALNAFRSTSGPSWRMVVAFGEDNIDAYGVFPGGQSGNPMSSHYKDNVNIWANHQYNQLKLVDKPKEIDSILYTIKLKQ